MTLTPIYCACYCQTAIHGTLEAVFSVGVAHAVVTSKVKPRAEMGTVQDGPAIKAYAAKDLYSSDWGTGLTVYFAGLRMRPCVIASLVVDTVQT